MDYLPAPSGDENKPLKALVFDSYYDNYKGAISYVRIKEGKVEQGMPIRFMATQKNYEVTEVGYFNPNLVVGKALYPGDVGYIAASIKNVEDTRVGDTVTSAENPAQEPLPGYKAVTPMVFCGIYPADCGPGGTDHDVFRFGGYHGHREKLGCRDTYRRSPFGDGGCQADPGAG